MEVDAIDYRAQKPLQYTQPQAITHAERPNMSQTESSTISNIPQANSHGPVCTEYFCMVCMTYFTTLRKLHKHMERFHDELRQEDRGIKRGGLKDSVEHIRKRNKAMNNEVEMSGDGFKNQDTESDNESYTFSEEDDDEYDSQSDDSDEGGDDQSVISDESGDDDDDDSDDDRDDIKYMRGFGDIKFVGDKIYEQADSKLDLDNEDIEIDGDVYKLNGGVYKRGGHTLYLVNGMLFEECEGVGSDEIMNWDGKCFKRLKLGWEEKLERDKQELKTDKHELEENLELEKRKMCEDILTHVKSLKGNFSEYIENASDHVIDQIQNCCFAFMDGCCPCKRRGSEILANLVRKDMKKIIDPDVSRSEKRKILSSQQKGAGIFSLLLGTVLPAIVSAL